MKTRGHWLRRYVDIEFGLYGALCVGFLVGGLGKMPGVYSRPTTYNRVFLKEQFMLALNTAFSIPQVRLSIASLASFPGVAVVRALPACDQW